MKPFLMFRDRDFDPAAELPANAADLMKDLELGTLFRTMSGGDSLLLNIAKTARLCSLQDSEAILYRQQVVADCLDQPEIVRRIYSVSVEAIEGERKVWGWMSARYPEGALHRSLEVLRMFVLLLKKLRRTAEIHGHLFRSEAFRRLFQLFMRELDDDYLRRVGEHLENLAFRNGMLISAGLGRGNKGVNYVLRKPWPVRRTWMERVQDAMQQLLRRGDSPLIYEVADRDEAGFRALEELRSRGVGHVAAALAQSTGHILNFFQALRLELGFYIGCLNLREQLAAKGEPLCFPVPVAPGLAELEARGLGVAQLMMQCGMFVPAESFRASLALRIFTHFKREEDMKIESGKLDEELRRMSAIVDHLQPDSLVLFNESFASTNEREGSEMARQIVRALLESRIKVFYVTHMFDLARSLYRTSRDASLFLRAERLPDGRRTFRLIEGEPLPTSHGEDLYRRILAPAFGDAPGRALLQ